jgi:tetratricopeptide (TPR) repeat protein
LKSGLPILLALLISCGEETPVSQGPSAPKNNPTLAAAQFALAKNHLANAENQKALPYLIASLSNQSSNQTQTLLADILASTDFTLPFIELRHPFPVLRFKEAGENLFVAVGGKYPTVIRWDLSDEPSVGAIMFPAKAEEISHLTVSPDSKFIIIHRDPLNLLCHADTLKPITVLDAFAEGLDPETCQPFSDNGLLLANPSTDINGFLIWRIHDSNSGEILRSETLISYLNSTRVLSATFEDTTLCIAMDEGSVFKIPLSGETAFHRSSPVKAAAQPLRSEITRTSEDTLTIHRTIRLNPDETPNRSDNLLVALSGYELDPTTQTLSEIPTPNRLDTLAKEIPGKLPETLRLFSADTPITRRLADAYPDEFPELTAPERNHAEIIQRVFATGDREAILAVIDEATHGLPFATAFFLALDSQDPDYISRALEKAADLPPALLALAKRDVTTLTDFDHLRRIEDWHCYESPDFTPLLNRFRKKQADALSSLSLPEDPHEDDISTFSLLLADPTTLKLLGHPAIAEKAITAARTLSGNPEHAATAIRLAEYAQRLGTPPAACLRVRASAMSTLADFDAAHAAWIDLITHQPEETHLPADYTEAAYTAFETGNPRQAIAILNTGLFRFPNNPSSAIRSGWIALLTDHTDDALRYLKHATRLGLPPDEIENTTALLVIAHERSGDPQMARSYLAQLKSISPKWTDAESLAKLPWPEPFKDSLNTVIFSDQETEPWPLPESDPIDTAPLPGGFPIEEPPLPSR